MTKVSAPTVIFVRPQAAGNLGALARAMSNFDCDQLRIVGPLPQNDFEEKNFSQMDWALAVRGAPILEKAQRFETLRDALADQHLALGTSGRKDQFELGYARPKVSAQEAYESLPEQESLRWALVFGPEDDGLRADEAALCEKLIHIDTALETPSINIAMCAGLLLYHWHIFQKQKELPSSRGAFSNEGELSTLEDKESWLDYLIETLKFTQFFKYPDHEGAKARMRRFVQSVNLPRGELLFAFEILYQLRSWGQKNYGSRDFLKKRS